MPLNLSTILFFVAFVWPIAVQAGGPPGMYAIVDKIVLEPNEQVPERIQIWGYFTRVNPPPPGGLHNFKFCAPVYGYMYLSITNYWRESFSKELPYWQKAASTDNVIGIGSCFHAGIFEKLPIRAPGQSLSQTDGIYPETSIHWEEYYNNRAKSDEFQYIKKLIEFARQHRQEKGQEKKTGAVDFQFPKIQLMGE